MQYSGPLYYLIFLPVVMIFYTIVPQKRRWIVLLIASYLFFFSLSKFLIVYLLISTLSIYYIGLKLSSIIKEGKTAIKAMERKKKKEIKKIYKKKQFHVVILAVIFHVGLLVILKYSVFLANNFNILFNKVNLSMQVPVHKFMIPIGISFYTLQAVSYIIDVYRGTIEADTCLARLALFMAFFPQIMEGPICRYNQTAQRLYEGIAIDYKSAKFGIQRITYGLIKKMIIADRLNILIKTIFDNYPNYDGGIIAFSAICYTCQLYMEFSGTMDIVIGSAEIFNVCMPENFRQPFFSKSISEFWSRWHITLGTWFKDYIYYPLSLSSPLRKLTNSSRKRLGNYYGPLLAGTVALSCVWFCNGIWHGAAWSYIFFGFYHFFLILMGNIFHPLTKKIPFKDHFIYRVFQMLKTSILVCIGELFFRAHGLRAGIDMFLKILNDFTLKSFMNGEVFKLGLDKHDFLIIAIVVIMIFVISVLKEKGIHIREFIENKNIVIRWSIYYIAILMIIIFGAYGTGYVPVDPIYAGF